MSRFLYENHRGSPTLTFLNVLGVLNVLHVLHLLHVLHVLHVLHGHIVGLLGLVLNIGAIIMGEMLTLECSFKYIFNYFSNGQV